MYLPEGLEDTPFKFKGLLMQDWVFRLGYRTKFISDATRNEFGYLKLKCRGFGRESL